MMGKHKIYCLLVAACILLFIQGCARNTNNLRGNSTNPVVTESASNTTDITTNEAAESSSVAAAIGETAAPSDEVKFCDPEFEKYIRYALDKETGVITYSDLEDAKDCTSLSINRQLKDIQDIITFFPDLRSLELVYTGNGNICGELSKLKQLEYLQLSTVGADVTIDGLGELLSLKSLSLSAGEISFENINVLSKLDKLESVSLVFVKNCDLSFIANMPNVKEVDLEDCDITDVSPVTEMIGLDKLSISYDGEQNKSQGLASYIGIKENPNLKYLELGEDEVMTGYIRFCSNDRNFEMLYKTNVRNSDAEYPIIDIYYRLLVEDKAKPDTPLQIISSGDYTDDLNAGLPPDLCNAFNHIDVNFDGKKDILILNGYFGNQGGALYTCYLWDANSEEFVMNESFGWIMNVSIDSQNKVVLSCWRNSAASHSWAMFRYLNNEYVMISCLTAEVVFDDSLPENQLKWQYTDERLIDGTMQITEQITAIEGLEDEKVQKFYDSGSFWDLDGDKWRQLDNNGTLVDFSIYNR